MKRLILITLIAISWSSLYAIPLGDEFTYQGELNDSNGNPHDGVFDFKFVAFDAESDGIGNNLGQFNADNVQVSNGIFTTKIDYSILGNEPFMGDKVWLEISVRIGTSTGGYQQLLPRQQVTATPYAIHAKFVDAGAISDIEILDESITAADIGPSAVGTTEIIASQVQRRVTSVCSAGEFMQSVNQDGTAVCVAETVGIISVTSADIVDGTIQSNDVDTNQIQQRIIGSCIFPEYLTSISQTGNVICARIPIGAKSALDSTGNVGQYTSIAIGTDGNPVISYFDDTNSDLKVVKCGNANCTSGNTINTLDSTGFVGKYTSIAIGADGNPVISYYDFFNGYLKIVKCGNASCTSGNTINTLDATGVVGLYTSIDIGTDDNPVISYYDSTNGNLKIVKCGDASCTSGNIIRTIASNGDVGQYTSIAIGSDGYPVISYFDNTNQQLKTVKCFDASCALGNSIITIEATSLIGYYNSIAIGTDGNPVISYYDVINGLKIVKCGNSGCSSGNSISILDSNGDIGLFTSIAIGADGNPVISYYDETNDDLKIIKCGNVSCTSGNNINILDANSSVGQYTSIAIGTNGNPVISYYDSTNGQLKFYSCGDERCSN